VTYQRASTAVIENEGSATAVRGLRLQIVSGPDTGATHFGRSDRVIIGSDQGADLVLTDSTVSRFHCEVVMAEDGVRVRDLSSRNGTLIDGVAIEAARIERSVTLSIGRTRVRCELVVDGGQASVDDGPAEPEPAESPAIDTSLPIRRAREQWVHYFERCYLADLLAETGQNVTAAARRAGIDRVHMHRLLSRAGLR